MLRRQQKSYSNKTLLKSLWNKTAKTSPSRIYLYKSLKRGIYTDKPVKRGIYTDKSLIYNQIQFISPALPCYIIKPSPDFQFVNMQQGCKLNKGCSIIQ